jgi:hypothetical protein
VVPICFGENSLQQGREYSIDNLIYKVIFDAIAHIPHYYSHIRRIFLSHRCALVGWLDAEGLGTAKGQVSRILLKFL